MSKSKEYYDVGNTWLMKLDIGALKKMNHKTLEDVKELIEKKLTEAKKNKGGGFRQFAPTEKEITIDARIEMKIAVCESLIYELEKIKL